MSPQEYLRIVRAAHQLELARVQYNTLLLSVGLDPAKPHRYDDATLEIVAVDEVSEPH